MIQVTELNTKHTFFNMCSHLHVSAEGNILFVKTHVQSGPVWSEFYTFSPIRSVWSGPKSIHNPSTMPAIKIYTVLAFHFIVGCAVH